MNFFTDYDCLNDDKLYKQRVNKEKCKIKKQFICDICDANLSSKQKIVEHLQRHVKYICQICSERFENRHSQKSLSNIDKIIILLDVRIENRWKHILKLTIVKVNI